MTHSGYDIEGNLLVVTDPLGRTASTAVYDMTRRAWRTELLDAGVAQRARPARRHDRAARQQGRAHSHRLRRAAPPTPTLGTRPRERHSNPARDRHLWRAGGASGPRRANLLGRAYDSYDEAGRQRSAAYDFQGNLLDQQRQVLSTGAPLRAAAGRRQLVAHGPAVDWQPPATTRSTSRRWMLTPPPCSTRPSTTSAQPTTPSRDPPRSRRRST